MFRALLCPSSGARDCNVDYHIGRFVLSLLYVGGYLCFSLHPGHYSKLTSNIQQTKNETTNVVIKIIVVSS